MTKSPVLRPLNIWDDLRPKVCIPHRIKKARPIDPIIAQLIVIDPTRTALFKSEEFRTALNSLATLPSGEMKRRLLRLLNVLTGYARPLGEAEFLRQRHGPLHDRAKKAATLMMKAADVLGHHGKFLPGDAHRSLYTAAGIIELESAGELGAAFFTVAKALYAAGEIPETDASIMVGMGMDADNIAKAGVKKSAPGKAILGFLAREMDECLASVPEAERWQLASKLLAHAGYKINPKRIRALAKKGH